MLKKSLLTVIASAIFIAGYLTSNLTHPSQVHAQTPTHGILPRTWGSCRTMLMTSSGFIYVFEGGDGTIRVADFQGHVVETIARSDKQ